jgi:hypothetical protein
MVMIADLGYLQAPSAARAFAGGETMVISRKPHYRVVLNRVIYRDKGFRLERFGLHF